MRTVTARAVSVLDVDFCATYVANALPAWSITTRAIAHHDIPQANARTAQLARPRGQTDTRIGRTPPPSRRYHRKRSTSVSTRRAGGPCPSSPAHRWPTVAHRLCCSPRFRQRAARERAACSAPGLQPRGWRNGSLRGRDGRHEGSQWTLHEMCWRTAGVASEDFVEARSLIPPWSRRVGGVPGGWCGSLLLHTYRHTPNLRGRGLTFGGGGKGLDLAWGKLVFGGAKCKPSGAYVWRARVASIFGTGDTCFFFLFCCASKRC